MSTIGFIGLGSMGGQIAGSDGAPARVLARPLAAS